jgi:DNA-binding NtrC family response regulator
LFASHAYSVASAASCDEALGNLRDGGFALAVVDMRMPDRDGITLTTEIRECWPETDVIMITGHGSIKDAVDAMSRGACDFITKTLRAGGTDQGDPKGARAPAPAARQREPARRQRLPAPRAVGSPQLRQYGHLYAFDVRGVLDTRDVVHQRCDGDHHGRIGTGKELAARAVHFQGKRRDGRFVAINCAAVPEPLLESELFGYERGAFTGAVQDRVGKIELANGGTLFLDEVESIPLAMQAKLLRVLEERAIERLGSNRRINVDMRVVAATNVDLAQAVADGQKREDFYYRINVVPVRLPPLRQRLGDLAALAEDYFAKSPIAREKGIERLSHAALAKMSNYSWPGNIRELRNVLERASLTATGEEIDDVDLPSPKPRRPTAEAVRFPPFVAGVLESGREGIPGAHVVGVSRQHRAGGAPRRHRPGDAASQDSATRSAT